MAKRTGRDEGAVNPVRISPDNPIAKNAGEKPKDSKSENAEALQKKILRLMNEAIDYYEEELEPDQTNATNYYYGRPFGDEKDGRSKVVNTVVRDAVLAAVPSLMRIVYEADNVAEFKPREPEDDAGAKQATDTIRYAVTEDNPGFAIFWAWIMDALVRRLGIVKWWWEEKTRKTRSEYTGLTEQEFQILASDEEVEIEKAESYEVQGIGKLYDVTAFHVEQDGRAKIECVPNEEFVFTPNARSLEEARIVAHVREIPASECLAMLIEDGMDEDEADELIEESRGKKRSISSDDLQAARQFDGVNRSQINPTEEEVEDFVLYAEVYTLIDVEDPEYDDDDEHLLPERRLFKCVGPKFEITNGEGLGECTDDLPFAVWTPIPEPHTIVGLSFWDLLKDIQRIISQIERGTLDSLAQAINPVTEVVNGMVNMQDFISGEVGGVRRVRAIGQTQTIVHHFVGGDTMPMIDYYNGVIEDRTGKNKGAMGLDADALQSTTKVAAAAILSASQQRIEIIARIFAETGLRPLFRGLLKLMTKHQTQARTIRLRNQYVQVDPRQWDSTMDVQINVALGAGTPNDKIEMLAGLAGKQQELLAQGSPLVSNVEIRKTLAKMTELSGYKNADEFFKPWGPQEEQQMQQQMAKQQPPPSPDMALVEVERQKAAAKAALDIEDFRLRQWQAREEADRERDKLARETALKEKELELKYSTQNIEIDLAHQIERDRLAQERQELAAGAPA